MKTRRKRKLKLDPSLTERILPPSPPKPKVTPQFRSFCLAWFASQDLRSFAGQIHVAALVGDKLFFEYLAKFLRNKPKRLPISENERRLLMLYYQKPDLSAEEALKELGWTGGKDYYGVMKQRALARSKLMDQTWREQWSSEFKLKTRR